MAKNVVKMKQRIAHNKTFDDHHDEMLSEGNDLLYDIFKEMKKNSDLSAIHLNSFEAKLSETSKNFIQQKSQNVKIKIPNPAIVPKSTFGILPKGKFSLMEKCKRTLKQIKHNRQMPKPRAHLAGLLNSPKPQTHPFRLSILPKSKSDLVRLSNSSKRKANLVELSNFPTFNNLAMDLQPNKTTKDPKSSKYQNIKGSEVLEHKIPASEAKKKKKIAEQPNNKEICSKNFKSTVKKNSVEENSHLISNNLDQAQDDSSGSDEYENFIKKVCPKKSKNKKNTKKMQRSTTKVIKKRISRPIFSESDSDMSDNETPASSKTNNKNCKKFKRTCEAIDNRNSTTLKDVSKSKKSRKKRKSSIVSKSVSSENDSDISDESSKLCYTRSRRIKRSHEVPNSKQSTSKDDSESGMEVVNDETYHDSFSESGDLSPLLEVHNFQSNNACDSQSSEESSVINYKLVKAISHKTLNNAAVVSNDNCVSKKVSGIASPSLSANESKPVFLNEASGIALSVGSDQSKISCKTPINSSLVSSARPSTSCKTSGAASLVNDDCPNALHTMSNSSFVDSNDIKRHIKQECIDDKDGSILNNCREGNYSKSTIVDLTESGDECENSFTIMPKIIMTAGQIPNESQLPSEESDIELLDVIVSELSEKSKAKCSDKTAGPLSPNSSPSKFTIKTEIVDQTLSCKIAMPNSPHLQTSLNEVAYSTGICQEYDKKTECRNKILNNDKFESRTVINSKNSLIKQMVKKEPQDDCEIVLDIASTTNSNQSTIAGVQNVNITNVKTEKDSIAVKKVAAPVGVAKNGSNTIQQINKSSLTSKKEIPILSKNVKKEPCDDDCEIVLDISSSSIPKVNLHGVPICNNTDVKIEKDSRTVKQVASVNLANSGSITPDQKNRFSQKLHKTACSNLNDFCSKNSELLEKETDLETMNIKNLIQNLKKEFATYQDILQTEQSVENTFKLLERCQAEKLMSLKCKISQYLESSPSSGDCNSIKNAVNKLLDSSELNSSSLKDCSKVPSVCHNITSMSDISVQDLKTFATMNIVPLSSLSETDIKPNLSDLQCTLKQKASDCEINSMSFGEKCIVCAKDASAACQQCAKVFFCSNECGRKYWEDGHKNACAR